MSRLFISRYLDEDVSHLVASLVRARKFEAMTAREAGRLGKSDSEQLEFAISQRMTLLTHNRVDSDRIARDYANHGGLHNGIIMAVHRSPYDIIQRLLPILNYVTADEMDNYVRYI